MMRTISDEQARVAAAATIAVMLEGPVRAFLQVAEYRELAQKSPFTTLSGTLGQIVIQLHTGMSAWLHLSMSASPQFPLVLLKLLLYIWELDSHYELF